MTRHTETGTPRTDGKILVNHRTTDGNDVVHADFARQLERELAPLQAKLNEANERLENNHVYVADPNDPNKLVRKDVEPGSVPDGIECRDETIKLQDEIIERLRRDLSAERDAVAQYIRERNELRNELDEAKRGLAFEIQRKDEDTECFRAQIRIADEQRDTLRTQLAKAQKDAEKYRQSQIGWKSPNSAEGEPG